MENLLKTRDDHRMMIKEHLIPRIRMALKVPTPEVMRMAESGDIFWFHLANQLPDYLTKLYDVTKDIRPDLDTTDIDGLWRHYDIANKWYDVLYDTPGYYESEGMPYYFAQTRVYFHDLPRFIGNIPVPLLITEDISKGILKKIMSRMFVQEEADLINIGLHSIDWLIGREDPPHLSNPDTQFIHPLRRSALKFKAIETISKDHNGVPADPDEYFAPGGRYEQWKQSERSRDRFSFNAWKIIAGHRISWPVDLEPYAEMDERVTRKGFEFIEQDSGHSMHTLWLEVKRRLGYGI